MLVEVAEETDEEASVAALDTDELASPDRHLKELARPLN